VLDALGLDLVEIVDRLPELVDGLVEDVRRIAAGRFFAACVLRSSSSSGVVVLLVRWSIGQ
jgi:hypothetical protein